MEKSLKIVSRFAGLVFCLSIYGCSTIEYYEPISLSFEVKEKSSCFGGRDVPDILVFDYIGVEGELSVEPLKNKPINYNHLIIRLLLSIPGGSSVSFDDLKVLIRLDDSPQLTTKSVEYFDFWDLDKDPIMLSRTNEKLNGGYNDAPAFFGTIPVPFKYYTSIPLDVFGLKPKKIAIDINNLRINDADFELPEIEFYLKSRSSTFHLNC